MSGLPSGIAGPLRQRTMISRWTPSRPTDGVTVAAATHAAAPLRALQIGRGLAAMFVVLFHLNNSVWGIDKYFPHPFAPVLSFGNAGVQFFFVLSGFIIYLVHGADIGAPGRAGRFIWRRFVRLYPTYWLVLFAFAATLAAEPQLGTTEQRSMPHLIASVLLLPYPEEPVLSVAWTLTHEVLFYAMFAIAILKARLGLWLFALWQFGCLANTIFGTPHFPFGMILSANNLLFSFGLLAVWLFKRWPCPAPGTITAAGAATFLAIGLHQVYAATPWANDVAVIGYGLASAIAIFGACSYERQRKLHAPRLFDALGDASYTIYLIHLPLLSALAKVMFASGLAMRLPEWILLLLLLCAVAGIGVAFSRLVEMPLIAALNRHGHRRDPLVARPET